MQLCGLWLFSAPKTDVLKAEIQQMAKPAKGRTACEHSPPVHLAGQGSAPAKHLPEEVDEHW